MKLLGKYELRLVDKKFFQENQEKIFQAWVNSWEKSGWGDENAFDLKNSIQYLMDVMNVGKLYVIKKGEDIIGFAAFAINYFAEAKSDYEKQIYQKVANKIKHPANILELAISPEHRGEGLGKKLMDFMEHEAKKIGSEGVFLWTRTNSKSNRFYQTLGYEKIGQTTVKRDNKVGKEDRTYYTKEWEQNE